jgi:hypothetical protein
MWKTMKCTKCGKYMRNSGLSINNDNSATEWLCVCGNRLLTLTPVGKFFHKEAIVYL